MSKISANTLPKRGAELTSTDLNEVYTDINDGFPLNGDNLRNEAIALPNLDSETLDGQSGIILRYAGHFDGSHGSGTITPANTQATHPFDPPTIIQSDSVIITLDDGDVLRVYFQVTAEVTGSASSPISASSNDFFWAYWLEWQLSSGGAWTPVENQTDYDDIIISPATYGGMTYNSNAAIFVNHCYIHRHSGSDDVDFPPKRGHCGQYFLLENSGGRTIYGLRVMCKGLFRGGYASGVVNPPNGNCAFITLSPSATHQIKTTASDLIYLVQRNR